MYILYSPCMEGDNNLNKHTQSNQKKINTSTKCLWFYLYFFFKLTGKYK